MGAALADPLVVLEDDPTGTQLLERCRVLVDASPSRIRRAAADGVRSVHLLTNSRSLAPAAAYAATRDAAGAARTALPGARIVVRGDSTLRGHVVEEYCGLAERALERVDPPLLLAMALPSAGRITRAGVHLLSARGRQVPLHETEYATDPALSYSNARLLAWAEERSAGLLPAARGVEVGLEAIRNDGAGAVAAALEGLLSRGPAVCVPDAETIGDLASVAAGLERVDPSGRRVAVRCGPAFPGILAGNLAEGRTILPAARRVVVLCGSWVPTTTRQLAALGELPGGTPMEADVSRLAGSEWEDEVARLRAHVADRLGAGGLAVVATPRGFDERLATEEARERCARRLARVLRGLAPAPDLVIAKGGVTSAVTLAEGLGAREADVLGPIEDGVSLWRPRDVDGPHYAVVPGNVGDDDVLRRLVLAAGVNRAPAVGSRA